jgi:hypothetical protein
MIKDKNIYAKAKSIADKTYKRHSAYKSMFLHKTYKKLGGTYDTSIKNKKGDVILWKNEQWIQIEPYVRRKEKVPCGAIKNKTKACRPLKKIVAKISMQDIIDKFGKRKILQLVKLKQGNMNGRLNWKKGTFTPSR